MIARALLLAPWLVLATIEVNAAPWLDQSDQCLASLRHVEDQAAPLETICPALSLALRDDPWGEVLMVAPEQLPAWTLEELAGLAAHYRGSSVGLGVDPASLDAVLAGLPESAAVQQTLWELFLDWLREWMGGRDGALSDWLPEFSVSDTTARWLLYGTAALIVLMAAALVFTEVRYWHRRRRRRDAADLPADPAGPLPAAEPVPAGRAPAEQLQGLFAAVVDRLQVLGLLPARPSLTHREAADYAQLSAAQRDVVGLLGSAAERVRFGAWTPGPADVTAQIEAGSRLLEELPEIER